MAEAAMSGVRIMRSGKLDTVVKLVDEDAWRTVRVRTDDGKFIPLAGLLDLQVVANPPSLERFNHRPMIRLSANVAAGATIDQARTRCREIADEARRKLNLSDEYKAEERFP